MRRARRQAAAESIQAAWRAYKSRGSYGTGTASRTRPAPPARRRPAPIAGTPPPELPDKCDPQVVKSTCSLFGLDLVSSPTPFPTICPVRGLLDGHPDVSRMCVGEAAATAAVASLHGIKRSEAGVSSAARGARGLGRGRRAAPCRGLCVSAGRGSPRAGVGADGRTHAARTSLRAGSAAGRPLRAAPPSTTLAGRPVLTPHCIYMRSNPTATSPPISRSGRRRRLGARPRVFNIDTIYSYEQRRVESSTSMERQNCGTLRIKRRRRVIKGFMDRWRQGEGARGRGSGEERPLIVALLVF